MLPGGPLRCKNTDSGVRSWFHWGEWPEHHNDQAKYLCSPYSGSIMKSFYRRHHWNLDTDFMPESRFHWALLLLPWSLVAQSRLNTHVQEKNEF